LKDVYVRLVFPLLNALLFAISFPYVAVKIGFLFFELGHEEQIIITRFVYPASLASVASAFIIFWQVSAV
jgi:hypothetical protein